MALLDAIRGTGGYDPNLPPSTPRPPGYWASEALRSGPLSVFPGIPLGMLGSGLEAFNENVAMRGGSLLGQATSNLPQEWLEGMAQKEFDPGHPMESLVARNIGRLGQAARDVNPPPWGDPQVFKESVKGKYGDVGVLEEIAANMSTDPSLPFSFGPKAGATLMGKVGEVGSKAMNLPFEAAMAGLGKMGGLAHKGLEKLPGGLMEQAPESVAAELITSLEDIGSNLPQWVQRTMRSPLSTVGRFKYPTFGRGTRMNTRGASEEVAKEFDEVEQMVAAKVGTDPLGALGDFGTLIANKSAHFERMGKLQNDLAQFEQLAREGDPHAAEASVYTQGALRSWYDQTKRQLEAVKQSIQKTETPEGFVPTPFHQAMQNMVRQGMNEWHNELAATRNIVNDIRRNRAGGHIDAESADVLISEVYHDRNAALVDAMKKWYSSVGEYLHDYESLPQSADDLLKQQFAEFGPRLSGLEMEAVGGPFGMAGLETSARKTMDRAGEPFLKNVNRSIGAQQRLVDLLKDALVAPEVRGNLDNWDMETIWKYMQDRGMNLGPLGEVSSDDLLKELVKMEKQEGARVGPIRSIVRLLDEWKDQGDLLVSDPWKLAMAPTERALIEGFSGGKTMYKQPGMMDQAKKAISLFHRYQREKMTATPSYLITNLLGGTLMNLFSDPKTAGRALMSAKEMLEKYDSFRDLWKKGGKIPDNFDTLELIPDYFADRFRAWGKQAPFREMISSFISANLDTAGTSKLAAERIHPILRWGYNALTVPLDPMNLTPAGAPAAAALAATGALIEIPVHRMVRRLASASEAGLRMSLGVSEMEKSLTKRFGVFRDDLAEIIRRNPRTRPVLTEYQDMAPEILGPGNTPGVIVPNMVNTGFKNVEQFPIDPSRRDFRYIIDQVNERGIYFSPNDLFKWGSEIGLDIDDAKDLAQRWANHIDDAAQDGIALANKRHVKYTHYTNLEKFIDAFSPFTRWGIRMVPNFMEIIATAPAFSVTTSRLNAINKEEAEQLGLSPSFKRMANAGKLGDAVAEKMFGRPGGKTFTDPSRVINPYAASVTAGSNARYAENPIEQIAEMSPFRPYPLVGLAGQTAAGALETFVPPTKQLLPTGRETTLPNFSRWSPVTGAFPGAGGPELWQSAFKGLTSGFMDPYSYRTADVQKRLGEMAVTQTGYPDHPLHMAARSQPGSELHRQATREVDRERGMEALAGLIFPFGVQYVRPEELKVRAAKRELPQGMRETPEKQQKFEKALDQHPWAAAHLGAEGTDLRTRAQGVFAMFRNPAVLFPDADPKVAERMSRDLMAYDAAPTTKAKESIKQGNPLVGLALQKRALAIQGDDMATGYIKWRQQVHPQARAEGEEAMIGQFLDWWLKQGGK